MVNFIRKHIPFLIMCTVLLIMIVALTLFLVIKNIPALAELWTRTVARGYITLFGRFNENMDFSLTEVSFFIVIISLIVYLAWGFSLLGNKKYWDFIHRIMMIVLVFTGSITVYVATSGIAYGRAPLELDTYDGEIKKEDFLDIATYFVDDYNACAERIKFNEQGEVILPYGRNHLIEEIRLEYDRLSDAYYNSYTGKAKALGTSGLFTSVGIVGMFFGVLGEANYNTYSTNAELPFYIAHELAHSKGVMREDDAQLVATYICLTSSNPILRYSGYLNTFDRILAIASYSDDPNAYKTLKEQLSEKIYKNYQYIYDHWKGKMFLYDFGNQINDWYLKTFGQKEGTKSYDDTDTEVDEGGSVISLSNYQKIYFKIYYDHK